MDIIVIAHKKEANSFIQKLKMEMINSSPFPVYSNKSIELLICGQGIQNAKKSLTYFLKNSHESIGSIINCGIAGRLDESLSLSDIYPISSVGLYSDKIIKETFELGKTAQSQKCISVFEPVSNEQLAQHLSSAAQVVDMELWALAQSAHEFKIPIFSFKLISDDARSQVSLKIIKKRASQYSEKLFDYFNSVVVLN